MYREQLFLGSMVFRGTCPDRSCIKQLQVHHACYLSSFCFPGTTNVGHESIQVSSTLFGFTRCDLEVVAKAKPLIQVYSQLLDATAPRNFVFLEYSLRVFEGSPVCDRQSLGRLRSLFKAPATQQTLFTPQILINPQLEDPGVFCGTHDECVIHKADDGRSRAATCHLFFDFIRFFQARVSTRVGFLLCPASYRIWEFEMPRAVQHHSLNKFISIPLPDIYGAEQKTVRYTSTWFFWHAFSPDEALSAHILRPVPASSLTLCPTTNQQTSPKQFH